MVDRQEIIATNKSLRIIKNVRLEALANPPSVYSPV